MKTRYAYSVGLVMLMALSGYGCDKGDPIGSCDKATDCPNVYEYVCRNGGCAKADEPSCKDGQKNYDETDVDCGGTCPACKEGKECSDNKDCSTGKCEDNVCVKNECSTSDDCQSSDGYIMHGCGDNGLCMTCSDSIRNGDETDTDCGGSCDICEDNQKCEDDSDCKSEFCNENKICAKKGSSTPDDGCKSNQDCGDKETCDHGVCASCYDNLKNGDETDVDCGGIMCPSNKCDVGQFCNTAKDCATENCGASGKCEAKTEPVPQPNTCSNNVQDGDETSIDCGGSCEQCGQDLVCKQDSDCKSWKCVASSGSPEKVCAGNGCESALEKEILINEVFTRPDESKKMEHSDSNQMKFIELYNASGKRVSLNNLTITVSQNGTTHDIKMKGCMDSKTFRVLYPTGKTLQSLDIDATQEAVELDFLDTSEKTIQLVNNDSSAIIDNVKVNATNTDAYNGISAGRGTVSTTESVYEVLVPHNTIPVATKPDGENVENLYSPGVPNTSGFPLG